MIILTTLNVIAILLCMYALISKRYSTKSKDDTVIFLCLQFLFFCNLWASIEGSIVLIGIFTAKNIVNFALLLFCMYGVKKDNQNTKKVSLLNRIINKTKNIIIRIKELYKNKCQKL